jgi:phosphatidylglycerophosphate synthase
MSILDQFIKSLKLPEAEEITDLIFFRPLAFIFVKAVYPTNITPNQISLLSMVCGILAGIFIAFSTGRMVFWGGVLVALCSIFDCADGQLARLKKNGTLLGRLIDGIIDYVATFSIFIGMGFYGIKNGSDPLYWSFLIVVCGLSYAVQAGLVDYYRSEYLSNAAGKPNFLEHELRNYKEEYERLQDTGERSMSKTLLSLYIFYSNMQKGKACEYKFSHVEPEAYVSHNKSLVKIWNLNGTSIHAFILMLSAFFNRLEWYIWYILIFGTIYTLIVWLYQKHNDQKLLEAYQSKIST